MFFDFKCLTIASLTFGFIVTLTEVKLAQAQAQEILTISQSHFDDRSFSENFKEFSSPKSQIKQIEVRGSSIFSQEELNAVLAPFQGQEVSDENLLALRSTITQLYVDAGYSTSGAFLPSNQNTSQGKIKIQVIEGKLEEIAITGLKKLNSNYIRQRLFLNHRRPINVVKLEKALQRLRLDSLIKNISAKLEPGSSPGLSLLAITVEEADTLSVSTQFNNARSPAVGNEQRGAWLREANLFGNGTSLEGAYFNSDGSNSFFVRGSIPLNSQNSTIAFTHTRTYNEIREDPFNQLNLRTNSYYYELMFRHPVIQSTATELAVGVSATYSQSEGFYDRYRFPLSRGADEQGRTNIPAIRFFQEFTTRTPKEVFSLRSQFSVGLNILDATTGTEPDADFFHWILQGQYARLLARDTLLIFKGGLQLAPDPLVPDEQFRLGGFGTVRGYRYDLALSDNGFFASAEVRLPILRIPQWQTVVQLAPFVDLGKPWNVNDFPVAQDFFASSGVGLVVQQGERLSASLYWGFPLRAVESDQRESGLNFWVQLDVF